MGGWSHAMPLHRIPWSDEREPTEAVLRDLLEREGWEVHVWRDPADRVYAEHHHDDDETLWVMRGSLVFSVAGDEIALGPGDRLELPAATVHRAVAGCDGAAYLIGRRSRAARRPDWLGVHPHAPRMQP
jgi:mannose-6-phosphate isomerase-like protein (cupin superfamily)